MLIRQFQPQDIEQVAAVFQDAVHNIGIQRYTPHQCSIWASHSHDRQTFQTALVQGLTVVAEEQGEIAAFSQLHPVDHINYLYCASRFARRGIPSALLHHLETEAKAAHSSELYTEASLIARSFFERHGFTVIEPEIVLRKGVEFKRFKMKKQLG